MNAPKRGGQTPDEPKSTARVDNFRQRLRTEDSLKRWEIYVSEMTKADVRDIAKAQGLSPGVAAEAILQLGVCAYYKGQELAASATTQSPAAAPSAPHHHALNFGSVEPHGAIRAAGFAGMEPAMACAAAVSSPLESLLAITTTPLAEYTSRTSLHKKAADIPGAAGGADPMQDFFNKAKSRKSS